MVILDEVNIAVHYGLISADDVLKLLDRKPPETEVIITGRYADEKLIKKADLVTEMRRSSITLSKASRQGRGLNIDLFNIVQDF